VCPQITFYLLYWRRHPPSGEDHHTEPFILDLYFLPTLTSILSASADHLLPPPLEKGLPVWRGPGHLRPPDHVGADRRRRAVHQDKEVLHGSPSRAVSVRTRNLLLLALCTPFHCCAPQRQEVFECPSLVGMVLPRSWRGF
jgi:hypothetical protein